MECNKANEITTAFSVPVQEENPPRSPLNKGEKDSLKGSPPVLEKQRAIVIGDGQGPDSMAASPEQGCTDNREKVDETLKTHPPGIAPPEEHNAAIKEALKRNMNKNAMLEPPQKKAPEIVELGDEEEDAAGQEAPDGNEILEDPEANGTDKKSNSEPSSPETPEAEDEETEEKEEEASEEKAEKKNGAEQDNGEPTD